MKTSWKRSLAVLRQGGITYNLRNPRHPLAAPDQPPYPGEVENADPQPVPQTVIRHAMPARPVDHIDISDAVAVAAHQSRKKSVQAIEIGEREEYLAAACGNEYLEAK